jgi:hypothetical protein
MSYADHLQAKKEVVGIARAILVLLKGLDKLTLKFYDNSR